jgi:hypothetical protein
MAGYASDSGSERAVWHHAAMRGTWVIETQGRDVPPGTAVDVAALGAWAADRFATGYGALENGDRQEAERALADLQGRAGTAPGGTLVTHCAGPSDPSEADRAAARVMALSLRALVELGAGRTAEALALLETAAAEEAAQPLEYGPPAIVKPSHELYGEVLLRLGRPAEAQVAFAQALARAPRRRLSLLGLAAAAGAAGDRAAQVEACAAIDQALAGAEPGAAAACTGA